MSDITGGAPIPKAVQPVSHGTDKATGVARDRQQTDTQTREEDGRDQKKPQQQETTHGRDPAVSISASAAHLHVGEKLKQKVATVDPEGRPIIETETATFALRPDAGLKAGDDVTLVVKDISKQLTADLLQHNSRVIDPPIKLNLIVIAIHTGEQTTPPTPTEQRPEIAPGYKPRQNFVAPKVTTNTVNNDAETLARVLARGSSTSYFNPASQPLPGAKGGETVQNPANLAALISAQQNSNQGVKQPPQANPVNTPLGTRSTPDHIIPKSTLTEVSAPPLSGAAAIGLGAVIPAINLAGKAVNIQLLDPSVSKVSPSEVATVTTVRALTPQDAKSLPMAAAALGNTSALAHVETDKGVFVTAQAAASSLAGEMVRVSSAQQTGQATHETNQKTFNARLQGPHAAAATAVRVQLPDGNTPANPQHNQTTVTAVHIVRAFLTAEGPKSDVRLETPLGDISLTLGNNLRPVVGDTVAVLPPPAAADPTSAAYAQASGAATSASLPPVSLSQWPSFEQTYSLLQSVAPAGAEALQSLTARTAQGGPKLANSAMFLMSALGAGDASKWLGKTAESALSERNPRLLDMLKDDISRMLTLASDTSGDWRAILLPLDAKNQDMPMLAMLFGQGASVDPDQHRKGEQSPGEQDNDLKRFVLEVQFSVLGSVQLDGTIKGQRFDLMVRSMQQFPAALTQETSELFHYALAAGAFTGSLGFSVEESFPVDVAGVLQKMSPERQQQLA